MRSSLRFAALAAALVVLTPASMLARPVVTPAVRGTVTDSTGIPLPNVQVIVAALNRSATTNARGQFTFQGLPTGTYHLSAMLIGFAPGHADVVVPASGADVNVKIVMRTAVLRLSSVEVTATPMGSDPRDVPQSTVQLTAQALSRQMAPSVAQTLSQEPGIAVRFNGPAAAPVIRGLQGERVLVLQDGDRAGDLSSAAPDHAVSVDPLAAQRVEVVRGPASLLYGNQALGGVVNVISNDIPTSIPTHVEGSLAANAESVNPGGAATLGLTVPLGTGLAIVARGGGRHTQDLRQGGGSTLVNTFNRNYYGVGGVGFSGGGATGGLIYRGYKFTYGLPSDGEERSKIDGHRHEVVGRSDFTLNAGPLSSLRVSGTAQWYAHSEINELNGETNTSFDLKTQTVDLLAHTQFGAVKGAVGVSGLFKQYAALGAEALTPAANSNGLGAFLFEAFPLGDTHGNADALVPNLQVGGRLDSYRIDIKTGGDDKFNAFVGQRNFNIASGSVGLSVPIGKAVTVSASAARAFRAPSVEELSSNAFHEAEGAFDVGNPALKAEVNQGVDGIVRLQTHGVNGQLAGYFNSIQNFITPNIVKDTTFLGDEGPKTVPLNRITQADARLRGIEGQVETQVAPHVVLGAMGDMVRGELTANKEPLAYMPAARLGGLARLDDGTFSLEGEYRHAFAQTRVPPAVSESDPSGITTGKYDLLNASVGWTVRTGDRVNSIVLRVDNLFDEKYVEATSRLKAFAFNPGRNFSVVYRVLF